MTDVTNELDTSQADAQEASTDTTATSGEQVEEKVTSQEEDGATSSSDSDTADTDPLLEGDEDEATDEEENGDDAASEGDDDEAALVPLAKLKKVRNEAKNLRERLKTAEARVTELESGTNDEQINALTAEVSRLQNTLTTERLNLHLTEAANASGAIEPSAVSHFINVEDVTWEGDKPTNLTALLGDVKTRFPKLFVAAQGSGNVGSRTEPRGANETQSASDRIRNAYRK